MLLINPFSGYKLASGNFAVHLAFFIVMYKMVIHGNGECGGYKVMYAAKLLY
jgi:hypothetical protein